MASQVEIFEARLIPHLQDRGFMEDAHLQHNGAPPHSTTFFMLHNWPFFTDISGIIILAMTQS
jgi:hypothetical protein